MRISYILVFLLTVCSAFLLYEKLTLDFFLEENGLLKQEDSLYFEFLLASGEQRLLGDGKVLGVEYDRICMYGIHGIEGISDAMIENRISLAFEKREYVASDVVWPIILFNQATEKIVYISHFSEPLGIESGPQCWFLKDVAVLIKPPGLRGGEPSRGELLISRKQF